MILSKLFLVSVTKKLDQLNFCRPESFLIEDVPEFFGSPYQREEYDCLPAHAMLDHLLSDLVQIRIQGRPQVARFKVPGLAAHPGQVETQREGQRLDP